MRSPSRVCRTLACPVYGSQMAMAELVVPKSIPRISTLFTAYFSLSSYLKLNNNNWTLDKFLRNLRNQPAHCGRNLSNKALNRLYG